MNRTFIILLLLSQISFAQTNENYLIEFLIGNEKFLSEFPLGDVVNTENVLDNYNKYDFSNIWTETENPIIFGIIGSDYQRIKIKMISVEKNTTNSNEYAVVGKTNVKDIICDFSGTIELIEVREFKELHFGVDDEYKDKGIKAQGWLIANYEFKENTNQKHSGIFKGKLYSKWYLNSENQIEYDNIEFYSDGYINNAFVGTWRSYSTDKEKICNWGDYRVPQVNQGFDLGVGEFSPSEKYYEKGWENYQKAWLYENELARKKELNEWWK